MAFGDSLTRPNTPGLLAGTGDRCSFRDCLGPGNPLTDVSAELPEGWQRWSEEPRRWVAVYRPDVFDTEAYPAACLPTLYVTCGQRDRGPGRSEPGPDDPWLVTLYLEPEVAGPTEEYDDRIDARDGAMALARAFADGTLDYRSWYLVPRETYLDRLDELTGRET